MNSNFDSVDKDSSSVGYAAAVYVIFKVPKDMNMTCFEVMPSLKVV